MVVALGPVKMMGAGVVVIPYVVEVSSFLPLGYYTIIFIHNESMGMCFIFVNNLSITDQSY